MATPDHDPAKGQAAGGNTAPVEFLLQLRSYGISDQAVLRAMEDIPRALFVPKAAAGAAYEDCALPIDCGQTISQPFVVAYMTEQLRLLPHHRVLEIGTGSGYQAAILSRLAREVVTVERFRTLADSARRRLEQIGAANVTVLHGDGAAPPEGRFDRILVTAAAASVPQPLTDALAEDGILIAPVGPEEGPQRLVRITRRPDALAREDLLPVRFVPLLPGRALEL